MSLLEGKIALITGAGAGIGKAAALAFARNGATTVVTDINAEAGQAAVDEIEAAGGEALFVEADSSDPADAEATVERTLDAFGKLDVAVNNAGVGGPPERIGDYPTDGWEKVISVNLSGVFYGMRAQLPVMEEAGTGSIINVASVLGQVGFENSSAYVAAKHGVVGLTKNAGLEYGKTGVRINAVGPAFIETPLLAENLSEEEQRAIADKHAMGRLGQPDEVAELFLWLASDKASFATGAYYPLDGGYLAQ